MSSPLKFHKLCIKLCCYPVQCAYRHFRDQGDAVSPDLPEHQRTPPEDEREPVPWSMPSTSQNTVVHTQQPHSHLCQDADGQWTCLLHLEYFKKNYTPPSDPQDHTSDTTPGLGRPEKNGIVKNTPTPWPSEDNSIAILSKPAKSTFKRKGIIKLPKVSDWSVLTEGKISTFPDHLMYYNDFKYYLSTENFFSQIEKITAQNTEHNKYLSLENLPSLNVPEYCNVHRDHDESTTPVKPPRVAIQLDCSIVDDEDSDDEELTDDDSESDEQLDYRAEACSKLNSREDESVIIADFQMPTMYGWMCNRPTHHNDLEDVTIKMDDAPSTMRRKRYHRAKISF